MDRLSAPLQESILTLIALDDGQGKIASGMLSSRDFDETYRDVASRILKYRKKYGKAPGLAHLDDLMDDVIGNNKHKQHQRYMRTLQGIISNAEGLNAGFVLNRIEEFKRKQRLKSAILEAGDLYQHGGEGFIDNVEGVLRKALKPHEDSLSVGTFLNDRTKALSFLDKVNNAYQTGISEFDKRGFGPTPGQLLVYMAATGMGKSWFCIQMGRECLMQNARVLHVTLEMSEDKVIQRYFQNLFAISKRSETFDITKLKFDEYGRVRDLKTKSTKTRMSLDSPDIHHYLMRKMKTWGTRLGRLIVKGFPSGTLTVTGLEAYIEMLEFQFGYIPNVLIVDYPDLMKIDKNDLRVATGRTIVDLRGLMQAKNLAGICPTQTNRKGWDASTVKSSMISEDASKLYTADMSATYSRTEQEKKMGLARLTVNKCRDDEAGYSIIITQNYAAGQFVLQSARMSPDYWSMVKPKEGEDEE